MNKPPIPRFFSEGLILVFVVAPLLYLARIYASLPEMLPMHFNMAGEVDRYGHKQEIWIPVLLVALPIYGMLLVLPMVEKKADQDAKWKWSYYRLRLFMQLCLSSVATWIVYTTQNPASVDPGLIFGAVFCGLFVGLGLLIPADGSANALAIRTPWTQNNPPVESKTRRFTRVWWTLGGLLGIMLVVWLPSEARLPVSLVWMLVLAFSPIVYSWRLSRSST